MKEVKIGELKKDDMVLIAREQSSPGGGKSRTFCVARVSGIIVDGRVHFWFEWKVRYYDDKPQMEESSMKLSLPLNIAEPPKTYIWGDVRFFVIGKWDEKTESIE